MSSKENINMLKERFGYEKKMEEQKKMVEIQWKMATPTPTPTPTPKWCKKR